MTKVLSCITSLCRGSRWAVAAGLLAALLFVSLLADRFGVASPARAADPPVVYMSQVGKELMSAARTRSPGVMATVIQRHADVSYIGLYSLGNYRAKLAATDGLSFQQIAAIMTGSTQEEYAQMMLKGGRPIEGNRSKSEWKRRG